jgi:DHA2 family multidrug resistance protein-like MFS transporter
LARSGAGHRPDRRLRPTRQGRSAASISETSNELGIALGIAILGSIGSVVYRSRLSSLDGGLPAASQQAARSGITGAAEAATDLGGPAGERLLATAQEAFTASLTTVAWVGTGLIFAVVVVCAATITRARYAPDSGTEAEDDSE